MASRSAVRLRENVERRDECEIKEDVWGLVKGLVTGVPLGTVECSRLVTTALFPSTTFFFFFPCWLRLTKPLTHPENQKACNGNIHAMIIPGPIDPSETRARCRKKERPSLMCSAIRVRKKVVAKRTSERRLGLMVATARTKVGISMIAHKQNM